MSKSNRNDPRRASYSESTYSIFEFDQEFPDDATCLEYLVGKLYPEGIHCPKCERVTKHHRDKKRPSYSCQFCGHHEHPLKGTIFENSATSLKLWFYAIYLMASTRCGISAKQLERELGVTYKTAWRMFNKIRTLLYQDEELLFGAVEMDEAYIGGQAKWRSAARSKARGTKTGRPQKGDKTPVLGMAQRGQNGSKGKVVAKVVDDVTEAGMMPYAQKKILPGSMIYTDQWGAYRNLEKMGYGHARVRHDQGVYVDGDAHTNTVEGFWSHLKGGVSGVYHGVSTKHLQSYLDEYCFRYNNRDAGGRGLFTAMVDRIEKDDLS
jgi:transposase-like protein